MENEATKGEWIELKKPIGTCDLCLHDKKCREIKHQITQCTEANYRFRCPILVYVPNGVELVMHKDGD